MYRVSLMAERSLNSDQMIGPFVSLLTSYYLEVKDDPPGSEEDVIC